MPAPRNGVAHRTLEKKRKRKRKREKKAGKPCEERKAGRAGTVPGGSRVPICPETCAIGRKKRETLRKGVLQRRAVDFHRNPPCTRKIKTHLPFYFSKKKTSSAGGSGICNKRHFLRALHSRPTNATWRAPFGTILWRIVHLHRSALWLLICFCKTVFLPPRPPAIGRLTSKSTKTFLHRLLLVLLFFFFVFVFVENK